jgi:hypothetical protein
MTILAFPLQDSLIDILIALSVDISNTCYVVPINLKKKNMLFRSPESGDLLFITIYYREVQATLHLCSLKISSHIPCLYLIVYLYQLQQRKNQGFFRGCVYIMILYIFLHIILEHGIYKNIMTVWVYKEK